MDTSSNKELSKHFDHQSVEKKWYKHWMDKNYFHSEPNEKEPYTIVIPPPNVTGVLHMGHMLNNTIQDVLIRRARMQGYNACWVPGTDHASIATEAKVVAKLKAEGINKADITREEFLEHAFEWKEKYGGIILEQLKKLGASCDWERTRFTMEESLSRAVIKAFVHLHQKGLIYQGQRMTNWDPEAKTALSNEEVNYEEVDSNLYHVRYALANREDEFITIATTRPETILGDTAICVHPDDERYRHLKGAKAIVPIVNREIPIIFDEYVDIEFGTGALKVTPAHDENDYVLGQKHNLATIDILNADGTMSDEAQFYIGEDRFVVRKKIAKDLKASGNLVKIEQIKNKVGFSERTKVAVEPRLTHQWYLKMEELSQPALENVLNDNIQFFPPRFKNLYKHWLENIRDWCISRQLWWGQRIPAYYLKDGSVFVAETKEEALKKAVKSTGNEQLQLYDLRQEEDVVDTWFSSWLWPISVFDGFERSDEVDYYYPTNVLVTGWDIIFFWVARMIFAGYEFRNEKPFEHVYFTGMVRDMQGRKMSKQLGNSPDALQLIEDYGADGVRVGILLSAPAGNDLLFDEKACEQGRNFSNKIWNALKLVKGWEVKPGYNEANQMAFDWFEARLNETIEKVDASFKEYRLSEALMTLYSFVWDDFCSWLLEIIKPAYQQPIDQESLDKTLSYFEIIAKLLHPFMPFLTEELYHVLNSDDQDVIVSDYPKSNAYNNDYLKKGDLIKSLVTALRDVRTKYQLKAKEPFKVFIQTKDEKSYEGILPIVEKLAFLEQITLVQKEVEATVTLLVGTDKVYAQLEVEVDAEAEREKLTDEINRLKGFINGIDKKLSNERFVSNAPRAVVDLERKKKSDNEAKIKILEENLANLK
ncbi:MAG: valine--tRNA ligase [Bacteroidetes bacterium]|nr:valine--tRNA ligase [Bacteroidota bacterium]